MHIRIVAIALGLLLLRSTFADDSVEFVNNHPFGIHMPVQLDDRQVVIANVPASQTTQVTLHDLPPANPVLKLDPAENGIQLRYRDQDLGVLTWDVVVYPAEKEKTEPVSTKQNFSEIFKPIPLKFERSAQDPLFDAFTAHAEKQGIALEFELRAYHSGFLDHTVRVTNRSAPTQKVYAAVICRWRQPAAAQQSLNYNNEVLPFSDGASTAFREGTDRHLFVQRGVDWINTRIDGVSIAWLNDFTPSFTVHKAATAKSPARWLGANTAQLAQEAQLAQNDLFSITEIARPNIKSYRSRLDDNVLPQPGEDALPITSRLIFTDQPMSDEQVDQNFIAYTSYHHQDKSPNGKTRYTFGVPYTRFGTNYFPYSTLGENFISQRLPNMSKEGYWPLAPETVNQWQQFADDIRRDLRILKAMGFEISRLHHLELLWDLNPATKKPYVEPAKRWEYLDFYFGELKHLGLKALLDVKLKPDEVAELVTRYRPLVEGVEIDNEVLLFMLPDADVPYWKAVYEAVKKVAPEVPLHLTAHTNTGAFNRCIKLGVPFDKVGAHAYMDSVSAIPSSRDYALAVADYASKLNKEPVITEWNWRFLTRMTFEDRAKVYPPIYENVLKTRCMPTMYQFQFQDSLAMNPTGLKGMRRYEQLLLSRRPKPEALEMMKLIVKYGAPNHPNRLLDVPLQDVEADADGHAQLAFAISNTSAKPLEVKATIETSEDVKTQPLALSGIKLAPGATGSIPVQVSLPADARPGFYHVFLRLDDPDGLVRYAWATIRKPVAPQIDKSNSDKSKVAYGQGALDFNFNRPLTVIYKKDCPPLELESAWTLFITLESASGRPVEIYQEDDPAAHATGRARILIEPSEAAGPAVKLDGPDMLLVTGAKPEQIAQAAMDLTLRYWKNAKDSACRRVGLAAQPAGNTGNKTDLE